MSKYKCPRCGKNTKGSYSEGGLHWAICDECMTKDEKKQEIERNERSNSSGFACGDGGIQRK